MGESRHGSSDPAEGRANGKVILLGEHAVVYGEPALVAGVDRDLRARVERRAAAEPSELWLGGRAWQAAESAGSDIGRAWCRLLGAGPSPGPVRAELAGDLPAGVGLGFSAAAGVALARAVEGLGAGRGDDDRVVDRAMAWERVFHGQPSGVDVAAAIHGGLMRFSRSAGVTPIPAATELRLCIGLSGEISSTRAMVAAVAALRAAEPPRVQTLCAEIGGKVEEAIRTLDRGDAARLGALFDEAQQLLSALGVSTAALDALCASARRAGALGAKLTGAGGGGAVLALVGLAAPAAPAAHEEASARAERVLAGWRALGCTGFATRVGRSPSAADRDGVGDG